MALPSAEVFKQTITRCGSHLSEPSMRKLLQEQALNDLYLPNRPSLEFAPKDLDAFRDAVLERIGDVPITYMEFGVASGRSFQSMLARFKHPDSKFFGFDSFEGLPEDWFPLPKVNLKGGTFSQAGKLPAIEDGRAEFLKGWFQNTLPPFLATGNIGGPRPHLVHYDADLYSSTLFILTTLWHHLPNYYFIMDEFPFDELVALRDFVVSYPVEIQFFARAGDRLFGHLRRVAFTL